jgi:hypothetical protein
LARLRLTLVALAAGAVSAAAGLAVNWLAHELPCDGERLACNIDAAVGAYATLIWAVLGPLVFVVTLLVANNRKALLGATIVLPVPLIGFFLLAKFDSWRYVGFYPDKDLRTFLVMILPPVVAVIVQALFLRLVVPGRDS